MIRASDTEGSLGDNASLDVVRTIARHVVPLHFEHWVHFTQNGDTLREAFEQAGLADRLRLPKPGEWITV